MSNTEEDYNLTLRSRKVPIYENSLIASLTKSRRKKKLPTKKQSETTLFDSPKSRKCLFGLLDNSDPFKSVARVQRTPQKKQSTIELPSLSVESKTSEKTSDSEEEIESESVKLYSPNFNVFKKSTKIARSPFSEPFHKILSEKDNDESAWACDIPNESIVSLFREKSVKVDEINFIYTTPVKGDLSENFVFPPIPKVEHILKENYFAYELISNQANSELQNILEDNENLNLFSDLSPQYVCDKNNYKLTSDIDTELDDLNLNGDIVQTFLLNLPSEIKEKSDTKMTEAFDYQMFHRMIPEYNGNINDLNRFLACCDQFYKTITLDANKTTFLSALVRKLTDRAFDYYNKQEIANWDLFKENFRKYFASQQSFEGYQIELAKSKQNQLSVREFGEKIEKILNELNKICAEIKIGVNNGTQFFKIQNERLAIKSFINGLNDPFKNILRSRKFDTIGNAISDAVELETEEKINNLHNLSITDSSNKNENNSQNSNTSISNKPQNSQIHSNSSFQSNYQYQITKYQIIVRTKMVIINNIKIISIIAE